MDVFVEWVRDDFGTPTWWPSMRTAIPGRMLPETLFAMPGPIPASSTNSASVSGTTSTRKSTRRSVCPQAGSPPYKGEGKIAGRGIGSYRRCLMPGSRVERDFGGQEERASPGGILREVYLLLGGRGRTALADIEDAASQVHSFHAQCIVPLERDVVPHPRLVTGGSQYV